VEIPELLKGVTLSYNNINIFSPLAGIDNLIDMGFDALNKQIFDAIDEGFDELEKALADLDAFNTVRYIDENGNEVMEKYDAFTESDKKDIEDEMNAIRDLIIKGDEEKNGIIGEMEKEIYNRIDRYSGLFGEKILAEDDIEEAVKDAIGEGSNKEKIKNIRDEENFTNNLINE